MNTLKKPTTEVFAELAEKTGGNLSDIARRLQCSRTTVYTWINEDETFAQAIKEANETFIDLVESNIRRLVTGVPKKDKDGKFLGWEERPSETLLIFSAKTKGKERGWVERQELTGKNGKDLIPSRPLLIIDPENNDQIEELDIGADIPTTP